MPWEHSQFIILHLSPSLDVFSVEGYNDHVFSCNHNNYALSAQNISCWGRTIIFLTGGRDKNCFACKQLIFFFFAAANNLFGGLHTIYFGLLRLQIIHFSVNGSANNLFQNFPFPHQKMVCPLYTCIWPSIKPGIWNIPEHSGTSRNTKKKIIIKN